MSQFPTDFAQDVTPVSVEGLGPLAAEAFSTLQAQGYQVVYGLNETYTQAITHMAYQASIREYCPKDCTERFADVSTAQKWLAKGRVAYLLVNHKTGQLVGYGWVGAATSEKVTDGQTTFALRIGEAGQGQGLAAPFARLLLASASTDFDVQNVWLETWASNGGAVHIYHKLGFEDIAEQLGERPTIQGDGGVVADTRIFMRLSNEVLKA